MAEKQDFYEFLGISKTATPEEVRKACKKAVMKYHPEGGMLGKSDAEKAAAIPKYQLAAEAGEVLNDPAKRAIYDRLGHKGIENLKNGTTSSSPSTALLNMPPPRKAQSFEDIASFFSSTTEEKPASAPKPAVTTASNDFPAGRRREERLRAQAAARQQTTVTAPPSITPPPSPVTDTFREVAERIPAVTERLKEAVVPLDVLERTLGSLQELEREMKSAIERSRNNSAPRP